MTDRSVEPTDDALDVSTHVITYPRSEIRPCHDVRWTDAAGPHVAALEGRLLVGSAAPADVVIADPTVSRLHLELEARADGVWVRDLGSRNGTFLGDALVVTARVPSGARLRVGSTVLQIDRSAMPTAVDLWGHDHFGPLVGRSVVMRELFARLARVAPLDVPVLAHGETGTGKELVAQALHAASPRAAGPFVIVDCGALPESLLEVELFGHAKGAFTGAGGARAGAIEAAHGGTVFLDEVGELPLAMQPRLLRALEARAVRRLGETGYRQVDVRFVSATHRDLREMVNRGAFREDLYFRLAVVPVEVPPLRARTEDIALLAERFVPPGAPRGLSDAVLAELATRPWLGNVRELRNFVTRAVALGAEEALSLGARDAQGPREIGAMPPIPFHRPFKEIREQWVEHLEREYIRELLARHDRDTAAVAEAAGLERGYVYRLMRKHDL